MSGVPASAPAAPSPPVVRVEEVTKTFGGVVAVDDVSFEVGEGEFFSLLGPSGCGKTTTLRMLAGFETPTRGRILLEGRDATRLPPHRRPTNLVFQHYALFPHMTVWDNVAFGPQRKRLPAAEVRRLVGESLRTVQLEPYASRYPRELSGGQQQRVALARALANRPAVLLLDEPLGALDLKLREEMQLELKRIQREVGISFVYVTHDQGEALTMSDRLAVMDRGRIAQVGTPEQVYRRPATLSVAQFLGSANLLPCAVEEVGEHAVVRIGCGPRLPALPGPGLSHHRRGQLVLRPEQLWLEPVDHAIRPDEAHPGVDGRVVQVVFQGPVVRYAVEIAGGTVNVVVPARAERVVAGERVRVRWLDGDAYVLPDDEVRAPAEVEDVARVWTPGEVG